MNKPNKTKMNCSRTSSLWSANFAKAPAEIRPGTLCVDYLDGCLTNILYRSRVTDYGSFFDFVFNFVWVGNFYEIDIVSLPDFRGRETGSARNHWLSSDRGGRKICIASGHEPRNEKAAKKLAMAWADLQAEYIKTGVTPDQQINRR